MLKAVLVFFLAQCMLKALSLTNLQVRKRRAASVANGVLEVEERPA